MIAKDKLNQGAILYNQGRTREAQVFFREATETDPKNAVAWLYLGATLVRDYKEESEDKDKQAKQAADALKVYETALDLSRDNCTNKDNAVSYIATIYDDLNKENEWRNWLLRRAEDTCATKEVKSTTYYTVAVRYWRCSFDQTERYKDKTATDAFHYRNMDYPAALPDKQKAESCTTEGLKYIDKALAVDPEYYDALYYKSLLYYELEKLTKDQAKRKEYGQIASKIGEDAIAMQKKKQAQQPAQQASQ